MATAQWVLKLKLYFNIRTLHVFFFQSKKGCDKLENACYLAGVKIIDDFTHHFTQVTSLVLVTAQISFTKKSKECPIK